MLIALLTVIIIGGFFWLISLQDELNQLKIKINKWQNEGARFPKQESGAARENQPAQPTSVTPVVHTPAPVVAPQEPAPAESISIVQVFSWVGGFALLLGVGFGIKYALDNQLLSVHVRILGSCLFGLILWAVGLYIREARYQTTAHTLCASGVTIFYIALFAAYHYYHLVGLGKTFFLLAVTSLLALGTARWKNSQGIGILAQIIGFLVPFLLPAETPHWFFLLSYTAFIVMASLGASWKKNWNGLLIVSLIFVGISQLIVLCRMPLAELNLLFGFCLLFGGIFLWVCYQRKNGDALLASAVMSFGLLGCYVLRCLGSVPEAQAPYFVFWTIALLLFYSLPVFLLAERLINSVTAWVAFLLVGFLSGVYLHLISCTTYEMNNGVIFFLFMCLYSLVFYGISNLSRTEFKLDSFASAGSGLLSIFFLTGGLICQFKQEYLALILAVEGCGFLFLAKYKQIAWLQVVSMCIVGVALAKLFLVDIWALAILSRIIVLIGVAGILILGAVLYQNLKPEEKNSDTKNDI